MKKKIDFVTNSSSASFIIGAKKDLDLKVPITIEVDLQDFVTETITTLEKLNEYWDVKLCREDEKQSKEYLKCKELIETGENVLILHCSDEDSSTEAFLCNTGIENISVPGLTIIQGKGGY